VIVVRARARLAHDPADAVELRSAADAVGGRVGVVGDRVDGEQRQHGHARRLNVVGGAPEGVGQRGRPAGGLEPLVDPLEEAAAPVGGKVEGHWRSLYGVVTADAVTLTLAGSKVARWRSVIATLLEDTGDGAVPMYGCVPSVPAPLATP